ADDRAGRPGNRRAKRRTGDAAGQPAGARAGLVVALGRLTGDRAADCADRAADDRTDGPADGHPDAGSTQRAHTGAAGLLAALVVSACAAVAVDDGRAVAVRGAVGGGPGDLRLAAHGAVVGLHHVPVPLLVVNIT